MHCMLCMSTLFRQRIKVCNVFNAMYVDTVDTKTYTHISAHNFLNIQPIVNLKKFWKAETQSFSTIPSNTIYIDTVDARNKDFLCIQCYLCQHCQYKTHPHISAYNFLNIQPIFNPKNVLESWDPGLFNHTIKYYICQYCQYKT